jgi:hypothetical protein
MPVMTPECGLVISYAYLWKREYEQGLEEGRKDRPCVIILAVEEAVGGGLLVTVAPITHSMPADPASAVEISVATKQRLRLDAERSWIMVSEGNRFVWPGPDLRPIDKGRFDYGFLPPKLFQQVQQGFVAYAARKQAKIVKRTE